MNILTKIFNKITLRDYYKKQYDDMLFSLIESKYKPKAIQVAKNKNLVFKEDVIFKMPVFFFLGENGIVKVQKNLNMIGSNCSLNIIKGKK